MLKDEAIELYKTVKYNTIKFNEEIHCPLILRVMSEPDKSTVSAFCVEAQIGEKKFYSWLKQSEVFAECYSMAKMYARENWEEEGRVLKDEVVMPGTSNYKFEYWRMIGWSRFGVGKNSRIRLDLDPKSGPDQHYGQLLEQASQGDFTAGEIKQLMEAVNVGLSTHQVFKLQQEIDQLKSDLATMNENANGNNSFTDKGIA